MLALMCGSSVNGPCVGRAPHHHIVGADVSGQWYGWRGVGAQVAIDLVGQFGAVQVFDHVVRHVLGIKPAVFLEHTQATVAAPMVKVIIRGLGEFVIASQLP